MAAKKSDKAKENEGVPGPDSAEALRAANELFTQFMRRSPVYAYIKSVTPTESRILMASDNYQEMLGISNLDIVGKTAAELFPPEFADKITGDDWVSFANGKVLWLDKYMNERNYVTIKFPFVLGDKNILAGYMVDVTANEEAQRELREREETFRRSHDDSPLGICVVTAEGDVLYANQALLDMYGFESDEDLKETSLEEKFTPECYAEHRTREEKQKRGEQVPSNYEIDIIGKDGCVRNIEVFKKEVTWRGEKRFQLFHYDITERRETDESLRRGGAALRAGEEKLRAETESLRAHEEAVRAEAESLKAREEALRAETEALRAGEEKLRAESQEMREGMDRLLRERETQQTSDEKLRGQREAARGEREELRSERDKLLAEGRALREESESVRAREEKLLAQSEALRAGEEKLERDAEALRAGEETLRARTESLSSREETMRNLFEAVGAALVVTDMSGKIIDVNRAWLDLSCYSDRTEVIGKNRLNFVSEKDRDIFTQGLADGGAAGTIAPVEMTMLRRDGGKYLCEVSSRVMRGASGEADGMVYVERDITKRRTAEQMVLASLAEKELLLRDINCQAGNNLNAVIALTEMQWKMSERSLLRPMPVMTPAAMTTIENRIRAMALVYERLGQSTNISLIDLQDYLSALAANLRTSLEVSPEISCSVNAEGTALKPETAVCIGMVVNELVTNAFKHAFPDNKPQFGADKCEVSVSVERKGGEHTLTVDDNGVGLPKNFKLSETSTLGLHLVKMLGVDQLGGKLTLNRTRGTRYVLKFRIRD